jgi:hypothetical protein
MINYAYLYLYIFFRTSTFFRNFRGIIESLIIYAILSQDLINHRKDDKI